MGTFAAIGEWFVSTKAGRAVLASVFALLAMAIGTSVGWIEGERFGYTRGSDHANAQLAKVQVQLAQANVKATAAARTAERAQADAFVVAATNYERGKADAQADANAVIAGLRAGNLQLRDYWTGRHAGGVPAAAGTAADADAAEQRRQESAGRIVGAAEQCDAQVAGLQQVIVGYLRTINGAAPDARIPKTKEK